MLYIYAVLALANGAMAATWQAVYTPDLTEGYIQVPNGTLYSLIVNSQEVDSDTVAKQLSVLASPPEKSILVAGANHTLYAVSGTGVCGTSQIVVSALNQSSNAWITLAQSTAASYYENSTVWYDRTSRSIYIYGGECAGTIVNEFYKFDPSSNVFSVASANPMPREMTQAMAVSLDQSSTVMIGGQANSGWLSMKQIAIWEYGSWTYRSVANSDGIDSRNSPLLLPLWNYTDTSASSGSKSTAVPGIQKILVIGGTVDGRAAEPTLLSLGFDDVNGWSWEEPSDIQISEDFVATLYETMVVLNNEVSSPVLYDSSNNWSPVAKVQVPLAVSSAAASPTTEQTSSSVASASTSSSAKAKLPVASIAAISSIIPVVLIAAGAYIAWLWWRRRQQRIVFQPRKSQIMSPTMSFSTFTGPLDWEKPRPPPTRHVKSSSENPFGDEHDMSQSDVQILVHKRRHPLRVTNPDEAISSDEEQLPDVYDKLPDTQPNRQHRRTESALSRRSRSSRKASQDFDFNE